MLVIAHRGANKEAPENSWTAFEKAIEGGSHRIELDARATKDGHPVVMHDKNLLRAFGVDRQLVDVSLSEFQDLKLQDGRPAPTIPEVLEQLLSEVELNIEIKGKSLKLADKICSLVEKSSAKDKIIISSPWVEIGEYLRSHYPEIKRACLTGYVSGMTWPYFAYQAPPIIMAAVGTNIVHPRVQTVDHNFMDQARNRNWIVFPWVTMDAEEHDKEGMWTQMATLGVDGLCTNYPRQLRSWLDDARLDRATIQQIIPNERRLADRNYPG